MWGILPITSLTLAPGKQKVIALFLLTFLTSESPMMSVFGEGAAGGEDFFGGDRVDVGVQPAREAEDGVEW